jgi:iron(II)-dependent oxidoreductase
VDLKARIERELSAVRRRSLDLLDPVPDPDLVRQHSPLMSPLVWDLAHVGNYEEQWLLGAVGQARVAPDLDDVYNAFAHPRRDRPQLEILGPREARTYVADVRERVLDALDAVELDDEPLLDAGFVYGMVAQHEHQHDETMIATLQLRSAGEFPLPSSPAPPTDGAPLPGEALVDGGEFVMGTDLEPWAYDNERPAHRVDVGPFWIDTTPVTNGDYAAFIADGGYDQQRWWTEAGWAWRQEADLRAPEFWSRDGDGAWVRSRLGRVEEVPVAEPVQHVCWYEAEAYARWAGKRLPTEAEWEKAASWGRDGVKRRFPWGSDDPTDAHTNLAVAGRYAPAPAGSFPAGESPWGCRQMIGDVWEWTASDFLPYPGFRSFPYREYSEVFFGSDYKVLRGGSWATHPLAVRSTFRNWDFPIRRQIFAGFRCARDA